jgi:hypothetical protein
VLLHIETPDDIIASQVHAATDYHRVCPAP